MTALGLLAMIGTGHNLVLSKLIGIFSILTSVVAEVSNIDKLKYASVYNFYLIILAL